MTLSIPMIKWQLWHQDTFDRETPRRIDASGDDLLAGLVQLWARHLFESVQTNGNKGFSRFNLWLLKERQRIEVNGNREGQVRIRAWVYGEKKRSIQGYVQEGDIARLTLIAAAHRNLLSQGKNCSDIIEAAAASNQLEVFERKIAYL